MPKVTKRKTPASSSRRTQPLTPPSAFDTPSPVVRPAAGSNNFMLIALLLLAFAAGYFFFKSQNLEKTQNAPNTQQGQQQAAPELKLSAKPSSNDHWKGNKDARIVMVEYSDLECPFCKQIHPSLQKIYNENGGKVAWIYRHFPLSFHPKAQKSAEATECVADTAGDEGFYKMVDAIYERMPTVELSELPGVAESLGYDATAVKTCIDSGKNERKVKAGQEEGAKTGVRATPTTVFYNTQTGKSKTAEGALPYEQLKIILDEMKKG